MTEQTRETLRKYFAAGRMPTAEHFGDLVDSMLNMKDEGLRKTPSNGLHVSALASEHALLSFFAGPDATQPSWQLRHGKGPETLRLDPGTGAGAGAPPALCVHRAASRDDPAPPVHVGIHTAEPRHALDVAGVVGMRGRMGTAPVETALPANGQWHTLIDGLTGCQGFEIVAGVGRRGSGRYALLHAVALNTFNPSVPWWRRLWPGSRSRGIRATSACYGRLGDRLQLRWDGEHGRGGQYRLCIRTGSDYSDPGLGPKLQIRCGVTRLWFDPEMAASAQAGADA